jgi:cytochrome P450
MTTTPVATPAHVPNDLVVDFDYHSDRTFLADPFAGFDRVRGRRVFFSPRYGGYWVLTRYDDIRAVFQDPATFSSRDVAIPTGHFPRTLRPLALDPPDHGVYRQILASAFSPGAALRREAEVRAICRSIIETFAGAGRCDLVRSFAKPLPTTIFVAMMGLPHAEAGQFLEWNDALLHGYDDPDGRRDAATRINDYLADLVNTRRRVGGSEDDLIGMLLQARVEDRAITDTEILDCLFLLFIAGLDTVTAVMSFSFWSLAQRPDLQRRMVEDPGVVRSAVEELLRAHAIVNPSRTATVDTTIADGVNVHAGDRILLATALATRDPSEFERPATIDFDRQGNRHLAFGAGPHRCLGSHLARLELVIALEEFHRRIPSYRLVDGQDPVIHGGGVFGIDRLDVEWTTD